VNKVLYAGARPFVAPSATFYPSDIGNHTLSRRQPIPW
jgi:hypothetical protein